MNQVWNIARKELSDGLRNRWLLAISLLCSAMATSAVLATVFQNDGLAILLHQHVIHHFEWCASFFLRDGRHTAFRWRLVVGLVVADRRGDALLQRLHALLKRRDSTGEEAINRPSAPARLRAWSAPLRKPGDPAHSCVSERT
jgi:hypothetical protein